MACGRLSHRWASSRRAKWGLMSATSDRNQIQSDVADSPIVPRIDAAGRLAWQPPTVGRGAASLTLSADLLPYPIDLTPPDAGASVAGAAVTSDDGAEADTRALLGLASWNAYLRTGDRNRLARALDQADWLVDRQLALAQGGAGWPHTTPDTDHYAFRPWLSAATQAHALSLLVRAYQSTGKRSFLEAAARAVELFTRDILDGGVTAPAGASGVVFESIAVYPAAHMLGGFLQSFLGLHDYLAFADDPRLVARLTEAHGTLHQLLPHYDAGGWTRTDLLPGRLATPRRQREHAHVLGVVARLTGCAECAARAACWQVAPRRPLRRARAAITRVAARARFGVRRMVRQARYPEADVAARQAPATPLPVVVPIAAYPIPGGMRAVMRTWAAVMADDWSIHFLTRRVGQTAEGERVDSFELRHRLFGSETSAPSQFPNVWFYVFAGFRGLRRLLRAQPSLRLVLPQDGVFTAALAGVVGRAAGVRSVSMDHGNIRDIFDPRWYLDERALLRRFRWFKRTLAAVRLRFYWPSIKLLARVAVRNTDAFLVAGDQIAEMYEQRYGVPRYKISRVPWVVDSERFAPCTGAERAVIRQRFAVHDDDVLIAMANRLHPTKGMDVAIPALAKMYASLPDELRDRVQVVILGEGPLRAQIEEQIRHLGLEHTVRLWGVGSPEEVAALLGASDVFFYAGIRDTNPVAVVEAMAAGCASVGTTSSGHITAYYAEGRGLAVPVGDEAAIAAALAALARDESARAEMGERARAYVLTHHAPEVARRALLRIALFQPEVSVRKTSDAPKVEQSRGAREEDRGT